MIKSWDKNETDWLSRDSIIDHIIETYSVERLISDNRDEGQFVSDPAKIDKIFAKFEPEIHLLASIPDARDRFYEDDEIGTNTFLAYGPGYYENMKLVQTNTAIAYVIDDFCFRYRQALHANPTAQLRDVIDRRPPRFWHNPEFFHKIGNQENCKSLGGFIARNYLGKEILGNIMDNPEGTYPADAAAAFYEKFKSEIDTLCEKQIIHKDANNNFTSDTLKEVLAMVCWNLAREHADVINKNPSKILQEALTQQTKDNPREN